MLISSTFTTSILYLSASDPVAPNIEYPSLDVDSFNLDFTMNNVNDFFTPILFFIILFVPVLAIAGAIWAIIIGEINNAITTIVKVFLIVVFIVFFVVALQSFGISIPGLTDAINQVYSFYMGAMKTVYSWAEGIGTTITNTTPDEVSQVTDNFGFGGYTGTGATGQNNGNGASYAEADTNQDGTVDWWEQYTYNLLNSKNPTYLDAYRSNPLMFQIGIASCVPMLISAINVVFGFLFSSKRIRNWTDKFFDKISIKEKEREIEMLHFNYWMGSFAVIIVFMGWLMFLNFARVYEETGIIQFTEIGYISIYMIMIVVPIIFLSMPSVTIYTKSSWKSTVKGVVLGVGLLYIMLGFMTGSASTLDAYSIEHENTSLVQVLNTFTFVAPAESMFFHVFVLAFALGWMYKGGLRNAQVLSEFAYQEKQQRLQSNIEIMTEIKNAFPVGTKENKWFSAYIVHYQAKKNKGKSKILPKSDFMFRNFNTYILIYIVILIANFCFSISHWIVLAGTIDFFVFWLSGLGMIYLLSGIVITVIGWRYGWLSAILVHAIYNTLQILMALMWLGGI